LIFKKHLSPKTATPPHSDKASRTLEIWQTQRQHLAMGQ
jgi:hypothetical protein